MERNRVKGKTESVKTKMAVVQDNGEKGKSGSVKGKKSRDKTAKEISTSLKSLL